MVVAKMLEYVLKLLLVTNANSLTTYIIINDLYNYRKS